MFLMPFLGSFSFCLLFLVLMCLLFLFIILYYILFGYYPLDTYLFSNKRQNRSESGWEGRQRSSRGKKTLIKIYPMKKYLEQERKKYLTRSNLCYILVKNMAAFSCTLIIQGRLQWNESWVEEISRLHGTQTVEWLLFTVLQKIKSRREQKGRKRMWFVKRVSAGLQQWRIYDKKTTVIAILELLRRNFPLCTRAMQMCPEDETLHIQSCSF